MKPLTRHSTKSLEHGAYSHVSFPAAKDDLTFGRKETRDVELQENDIKIQDLILWLRPLTLHSFAKKDIKQEMI